MVASILSQTLSSAAELRKNATSRDHFAGNKAKRDTALPPAIALKNAAAFLAASGAANAAALNQLSGGSRLVAPRDELVTARLESGERGSGA
ncbi:MAG: hypothetical protein CMM31_09565 [Rhodospirillaceae bacterium]|nr:hypothetical protein [Rhodospirillaceae bacterium]